MSTKSHIIYSDIDDSSIYFDCANQWQIDNKYYDELTFELSKKDIRIDLDDNENLVFSFHKDSDFYRKLLTLINK